MTAAEITAREEVLALIRGSDRFVLVTHENPDGDALGSLLAMHGVLTALGKDALMFLDADELPLPLEYRFLPLQEIATDLPGDVSDRTVIFLDCGNIERNPAAVLRDGAHLINVDHHHDNTRFGSVNLVVPSASCTAEIVWDLMRELAVEPVGSVADALYVALVTDTGRFMYSNTGPRAHRMAAELIATGVNVQSIYRHLYEDVPYAKIQLLGRALAHVRRYDDGRLTISWLDAEDFEAAGAEDSYSEGFIDHLRAVRGTRVAALVRDVAGRDRGAARKVSLRSSDEGVDVSAIARALGGGGHPRAAGFSTQLALDDIADALRGAMAAQLEASAVA
ncbi:MAG TPA: bifunctional oligoribonuclease/PAP phosphatase NrnA [Solirubrobacteraceae bacterium]|nr:bifunctional oligoribonuclease/PAP phosphatase NrnA [Solirubrobacteraceae bacterium]